MANTKVLKRSKNVYGEDLICNGKNQAIAKMFIANDNLEEDIDMFIKAPVLISQNKELVDMLKKVLNIYGRGFEPKKGVQDTIGSRLYRKIDTLIKKIEK